MPENKSITQQDRIALEQEYGRRLPIESPAAIPNIPFIGLDNYSIPTGGDATRMSLEDRIFSRGGDDGKLTGGSIPRSFAEVQNKRYPVFMPGDYDNEDAYGQGQSFLSKAVSGFGKGLALTGTTFLQTTIGSVNGIAKWIQDGKFSSFYDNELNHKLDDFNKYLENEVLRNYYTNAEKNARWYSPSKLFSANFIFDGIVKNLGFAAGAALSGGVYSAGLKALSALPGLSRLVSVGKGVEALKATEEALAAGSAAGKAAQVLGKTQSVFGKFASSYNALSPGGRAIVAGLSTTGEAGFEAFQNLNQFRDEKIQEYKDTHYGMSPIGADLEAINREADRVGNYSFMLNTALLSATNYIQFPLILGSSFKAQKAGVNSVIRQTGKIVEKEGKFIAKSSKIGKALSPLRYTFSPSEAFEEGSQYAISIGTQDYHDKQYSGDASDAWDSIFEGVKEVFGSDEGWRMSLLVDYQER